MYIKRNIKLCNNSSKMGRERWKRPSLFCNLYEKNKINSLTVFILNKMLKVEFVSNKKYVIIKTKSGSNLKMWYYFTTKKRPANWS